MNCNHVREQLIEIADNGNLSAHSDVAAHLAGCTDCTRLHDALRGTMALMDEWKAPEPSPFFSTRLRARVEELKREEAQPAGMFGWVKGIKLWQPVAVGVLAIAVAFSVNFFKAPAAVDSTHTVQVQAPTGSAVSDLQALDQQKKTLDDLDLLDDLGGDEQPSNDPGADL
jgi:hypothetical protein